MRAARRLRNRQKRVVDLSEADARQAPEID
jgi:hypothetical protein